MTDFSAQAVGAVVSVILLFVVTMAGGLARVNREHFYHPALTRYLFVVLFLFAALRVYSATAFVWSEPLREVAPWLLEVFRFVVAALTSVLLVLALAIMLYLWRLYRRSR